MRNIFYLLIIFFAFSCKLTTKENSDLAKDKTPFWDNLYMELDGNQELIVYNNGDSAVFTKWTDSLIKSTEGEQWIPTNIRQERFSVQKNEKDSLFKWTKNLVANPKHPEKWCTDYVGHLIVKINYGPQCANIAQSCEYSSVCDWDIVNEDTKAIFRFLKTKVKEIE